MFSGATRGDKLQLKDLKLKEGTVFIGGNRKSKQRILELKSKQIIELMEHQFTTRSDLRFINLKQVRTSVITHWLKQFNLRQVQYMAGHRYVSSTEGYLVNQTEDLQKDINEFYPF